MLRLLRINRLAVIDAVDVEFEPGFNVLTGETGAGKSILVEAVGLLLGGRASGDLVRTGAELASVEAIFQEGSEEILVRRELTAQGRSRAFINGSLATAGALRDRLGPLIELHGQHEHQPLLDPTTHLETLDAYGGHEAEVAAVGERFAAWQSALEEQRRLRAEANDRSARQDLAAFQLQDIERAAIGRATEDEDLLTTRRVLSNAARLERLAAEAHGLLYESDQAVLSGLAAVWRRVGELAGIDPVFEPFLAAREGIKGPLEELAAVLRRYQDGLEVSPQRLQEVEERLSLLERLKKKYGPTLGDVIATRIQLQATVEGLESLDTRLGILDRQVERSRSAYCDSASTLGQRRRAAAQAFASTLLDLLQGLAMERATFEVRFNISPLAEGEWSALGTDHAEFYLSPNPGEELRPLARIVSGGELSRIMLGLKTMIFGARLRRTAGPDDDRSPGAGAPVMIFDEVDAGLGGRVAEVVGRRLRDLGSAFQVLCITHLPQVAAQADTHFVIEKRIRGERTETDVRRLTPEARVDEVARMLAGTAVSDAVRASARELLARGADGHPAGPSREIKAKVIRESKPSRMRRRRVP